MPQKEHRKVIVLGGSKAATLPKEFLDTNTIKEGDELLFVYDRILLVLPIRGPIDELDLLKKFTLIQEVLGDFR